MLRILRAYAGLFVALSWVLLAITIPICLLISVTSAICAFYGPTLREAPLCVYDGRAALFAIAASAIAAIASSIALLLKHRLVASLFVVGIWSVILFGTQGARLFVKPGPEYFVRHLAEQKFLIPWQYEPSHVMGSKDEDPRAVEFGFQLCQSNLKGTQDPACVGRHVSVGVSLKESDLINIGPNVHFWKRNLPQMRLEPDRDGYQSYAYDFMPLSRSALSPEVWHYYVRRDSESQITRFVVCRGSPICEHEAVVGKYLLSYSAPLGEGKALETELVRLVESWRKD